MRQITFILGLCFSFAFLNSAALAASLADGVISARLQEEIAERLAVDPAQIEVVQIVPMNGQPQLRPGRVLRIRPSNPRRLIGRVVFVLTLQGADGQSFVQWVTAEVVRIQDVVVSKVPLKRHEVFDAEDLEIKTLRLRSGAQAFETNPDALVGKRVRRALKSGAAIRRDLVEAAPMIVRGDRITIFLETQGLQISTLGQAAEDGLPGESIKVINLDSKKIVVAEVIGEGRVRVGAWPRVKE